MAATNDPWTMADLVKAEQMWTAKKMSYGQIAIAFGVSRNAVAGLMRRNRTRFPLSGRRKYAPVNQGRNQHAQD